MQGVPAEVALIPWYREPTIWGAIFTGVIAAATICYVYFTRKLWAATKQSADAARTAAEAALKTAETSFAAHRPYIGVVPQPCIANPNDERWFFPFEVRNFGALPASDVTVEAWISLGGQPYGQRDSRPPCELFPGGSLKVERLITVPQTDRQAIFSGASGAARLCLRVLIRYVVPGEGQYEHLATFELDISTKALKLEQSQTRKLPG